MKKTCAYKQAITVIKIFHYSFSDSSSRARQNFSGQMMSSMASSENQISDSIMNWSMKISNYRRSVSRSPPPSHMPRSNSSLYRINPDQSSQLPSKSTTSWGKLKHSKSSSSNIAASGYSHEEEIIRQPEIKPEVPPKVPPSTSSPSLFRLFQHSKQTCVDSQSSVETTQRPTSITPDLSNSGTDRGRRGDQGIKTTSFSQLRQRSVSSCPIGKSTHERETFVTKKSIGIQHPPQFNDQNIQGSTIVCMLLDRHSGKTSEELMVVAARAARAAIAARRSTKSSLPDLTFLKDYADEKKPAVELKDSFTSTPRQMPSSGSDLLKRKTLKSIKRYRQTKQNTEPCAQVILECQPPKVQEISQDNSLSSSSGSGSSAATNTSGYASTAPHSQIQRQASLSSQQKQPLKSCLKRKDSQLSNTNNTAKLVVSLFQTRSTTMFVPYVGYLFTCDKESSTRYCYYNNLEKNRKIRTYKQLTSTKVKPEEFEDDDEEEESRKKKAGLENAPVISRSDNDLRLKKSVTFLAHLIEFKKKMSRPPTSTTLATATPAPPLQYNALIAMLNSQKNRSTQVQQVNRIFKN